jgi:putative transposase
MPRKPRIEVPGGLYHVVTRGNDQQPIYADDALRRLHLLILDRTAGRFGWRVYAYCLMDNHFHRVIRIGAGGLSAGMQVLNGSFALAANQHTARSDHLFGKRFWSALLETDHHLLEACRYTVLNPCRAGMRNDPGAYAWSSYRSSAGIDVAPSFLALGELWDLFDPRAVAARHAYRRFVRDGLVRCQAP